MNLSKGNNIDQYLKETLIPIRLSTILPNGYPLVVSLWYLYEDKKFYCAVSRDSKISQYLGKTFRCGFEIAADTPPYCGIRGYGDVGMYPDDSHTMLKRLYDRYFSSQESELFRYLTQPNRDEVVIAISPEHLYHWDFSGRMEDTKAVPRLKTVPDE